MCDLNKIFFHFSQFIFDILLPTKYWYYYYYYYFCYTANQAYYLPGNIPSLTRFVFGPGAEATWLPHVLWYYICITGNKLKFRLLVIKSWWPQPKIYNFDKREFTVASIESMWSPNIIENSFFPYDISYNFIWNENNWGNNNSISA